MRGPRYLELACQRGESLLGRALAHDMEERRRTAAPKMGEGTKDDLDVLQRFEPAVHEDARPRPIDAASRTTGFRKTHHRRHDRFGHDPVRARHVRTRERADGNDAIEPACPL